MVRMLRPTIRQADLRTALPRLKTADPGLLTPEHRAWRAQVLARAGYRCEAVDAGRRCAVAAPARLFADHIVERKDGGAALDVGNGQCLCGHHHSLKTVAARARRMAEKF